MLFLENQQLKVSVLDPLSDRDRLGSRYCTGGYIWQISGPGGVNLLSGPQYPDPEPDRFDGQGAPEVFETAPGADSVPVGEEVLVIGVGMVRKTSPIIPFHVRNNPEVVNFCSWNTSVSGSSIYMETDQNFCPPPRSGEPSQEFGLHLERTVTIINRLVCSRSGLKNTGNCSLPLRWFAHPFFPQNPDFSCCKFSVPVEVPQNMGFYLNPQHVICRHKDYEWKRGCFQRLNIKTGGPVKITIFHPEARQVEVSCEYALSSMPVWGNSRTFSVEPFFDSILMPGEAVSWQISYQF
jgi:hypothetical protein